MEYMQFQPLSFPISADVAADLGNPGTPPDLLILLALAQKALVGTVKNKPVLFARPTYAKE